MNSTGSQAAAAPAVPSKPSDELLGQLAHELTLLLRCDLEVSRCEQAAEHPQRFGEIVQIAVGCLAVLLASGALTLAAALLVALALPAWAAAAIVGGVWALAGAVLLRRGGVERLIRRLASRDPQALATAQAERTAAEHAIRATARAFAAAAVAEAVASLAERVVETGEREAEAFFEDLVRLLTAPGRIGIEVLARLRGSAPDAEGGAG